MNAYREISPDEFSSSPFSLIGKDWMLITVADPDKESGANAMTASWGGLGILWNKPVATVYVRPQRYTYLLCEQNDRLSLCFPGEDGREAMKLCGSRSGRDIDKLATLGINSESIDGVPVIPGSDVIMICKKAYVGDLVKEGFVDASHLKHYPINDFHRFYILEIEKILIKA
jgi:flavin reductase (DIM6/NTAB) family NADH-FMN oxidoreductase RutF